MRLWRRSSVLIIGYLYNCLRTVEAIQTVFQEKHILSFSIIMDEYMSYDGTSVITVFQHMS